MRLKRRNRSGRHHRHAGAAEHGRRGYDGAEAGNSVGNEVWPRVPVEHEGGQAAVQQGRERLVAERTPEHQCGKAAVLAGLRGRGARALRSAATISALEQARSEDSAWWRR